MDFLTIFFIAVGLAMDAFAVAVSNGICVPNFRIRHGMKQAVFFGAFQFLMPVLGYCLGRSIEGYIASIDHWIAFLLLSFIGGSMVHEAKREAKEEKICVVRILKSQTLLLQAIATSIDALAVGVSFAILDIHIIFAATVIGAVAFFFSFFGGILGKKLSFYFKRDAELLGGLLLIGMGIKILLEHLYGWG